VPVLCLQYPNGRMHRLAVPTAMVKGEEFELYGRRWRVIGPEPRTGRRLRGGDTRAERALICRPTTAQHL